MNIGTYFVGAVPKRPATFTVLDSKGTPVNLGLYDSIKARMLGSNNEEIDLTGGTLTITNAAQGKVSFEWPAESVFRNPGEYVLQLELSSPDAKDLTTEAHFFVRNLGQPSRGQSRRLVGRY